MPYRAATFSMFRLAGTLAVSRFWLRNAGSYLGVLWYLLEPLVFFLLILLLRPSLFVADIPQYPSYVLLGLIMVNFFVATTSAAVKSLRDSRDLVKSVSMPLESLPLSTVLQFCLSHTFEFALFVVFAAAYGELRMTVLVYPAIFAVYALFTLGMSFLLATVGAFIEDLGNIWPAFSRLLWLATPIFYAITPGSFLSVINQLNPISHFIGFAREIVVYGRAPDVVAFGGLMFGSLALAAGSVGLFCALRKRFAELL